MEHPAWLAARFPPGERVAWSQEPPAGAIWGAIGPAIGAVFAIAFGGRAVFDHGGPLEYLFNFSIEDALGIPEWIALTTGAIGFIWLATKEAAISSLTTWVVTDRRLVRVVRPMPWLEKEWPLADLEIRRVRPKKTGARVKVRVPHRWWGTDDLSIRARDSTSGLADALRAGGARQRA